MEGLRGARSLLQLQEEHKKWLEDQKKGELSEQEVQPEIADSSTTEERNLGENS